MGYLYYINIILICIIFVNIILQSIKLNEGFDTSISSTTQLIPLSYTKHKITAELRPCTIQLTNDADICDKLSDIYELSDSQIQVLLNKMKADNTHQTAYNMLQYVKNTKNTLPINSCKIQLSQWKEIKEAYTSSSNIIYPYKSITKSTDYNTSNLSGYCLYDIKDASAKNESYVDYLEDVYNPSVTQLYQLYNFNTSVDIKNIKDFYCSIPSTIQPIQVDTTLTFMRLYAFVDDTSTLRINKIDIVGYDPLQNIFQPKMTYNISKFFEFQYNNKQIILGFAKVSLSIYTFSFDICKRIKEYTITNNIYFSFDDFANILPKLVENNIELLPDNDINNKNIQQSINKRINDIIQRHNTINNQIQAYSDNISEIITNYNQMKEISCTDAAKCDVQRQYLLSKSDILHSEKAQLESELLKQKEDHIMYAELNKKLKETSFTLEDINSMLQTLGQPINYDKYASLLSNDDCIYLQI